MPVKELEKLGGLFDTVTGRSKPFLKRCSETKILAVEDYARASTECIELARQTLCIENQGVNSSVLEKAKSAIELGQLDNSLVEALENIRKSYLESVLRPAVRLYLNSEERTIGDIEALYTSALRMDGLLEVVQFLTKVQPKKIS
jgi:hypothetical protein